METPDGFVYGTTPKVRVNMSTVIDQQERRPLREASPSPEQIAAMLEKKIVNRDEARGNVCGLNNVRLLSVANATVAEAETLDSIAFQTH